MRSLLACSILLATVTTAGAEPCPSFKLGSKPLKPRFDASRDGGIVVGELPQMEDFKTPIVKARDDWRLRVGGKLVAATPEQLAPGLVVYRLPKGATKLELLDHERKVVGRAALATTTTKLPAPKLARVTSGDTKSRHVTTFVAVDLDATAPKTALALVVVDDKGTPLSWGLASPDVARVMAYSTMGGCVSEFPDGTVRARPGSQVTAFWVDDSGARSPSSAALTVSAP